MGITGTEVSKDAASMILTDDNFATIVKAVTNGRNVYANIKNAIKFLLSGNMSGILSVLYTSLFALPVPFQPVHLLFINLLTDSLPAIAIGMEPPRKDLLNQKPRDPKEPIMSKDFMADPAGTGRSDRYLCYDGLPHRSEHRRSCTGKHHGVCYPDPGKTVPRIQLPCGRFHL